MNAVNNSPPKQKRPAGYHLRRAMHRIHQPMSQPQPATPSIPQLTAAGKPRKRAPGAGAPKKHRQHHLSRVDATTLHTLQALATAWHCTLADAIARAAIQAHKTLKKPPA